MKGVMILEGRAQGKSNLGGEMLDGETKLMKQANRNKLKRIAELSRGNPEMEFNKIIGHINEGLLERCFHKLDGRKAVGIDRKTKSEYGQKI